MYRSKIFNIILIIFGIAGIFLFARRSTIIDQRFISYIADSKKQTIKFYWKNEKQENFKSIQNLKSWLDEKHTPLVFAMNGGMYMEDNSPLGLFIENKKVIKKLNTSKGNGNFYLQPNGVFYISMDNKPVICKTNDFTNDGNIQYATQSGPMLVSDGLINSLFVASSTNLNIRNGVGILPDNKILFTMSKEAINFYDFASYFKKMGCKNALYLDGFVSRTYLPEQNWIQTDGNFGIIIGITK